MANITYRLTSNPTIPSISSVKGNALTYEEMDANLKSIDNNLNQIEYDINNIDTSITTINQNIENTASDSLALSVALG